ncbi:type II secretion system F family protein [Sinomonas halotolerans]|uniref:Type II secretion system F family protein n=1 Tax=Sinomonas halotolerans TaxID=1644133 RepID=A0ABU9X295_9MICC
MGIQLPLLLGLLAVYAGAGVLVALAITGRRTVSSDRKRPAATKDAPSALGKFADTAAGALTKTLKGRDIRLLSASRFEQAGVRLRAGDFLLLCAAGAVAAGFLGFVVGGIGAAVLFAVLVVVGLLLWLNLKASRRQAKFAEQLPDMLQMLSGSLRAGHSLLRAVDAAAEECEAPMSTELRRVVNETRIGRDLTESFLESASRMKSQDLTWTTQAIEVQREVGGNLAEVLDNVNNTIRSRAQLSRQVRALAAEGKLSAIILVALPIGLLVIISVINPTYARTFYTTLPGWLMLGVVFVLLGIGSLWLSRLIKPKY